MSEPTEPRPRRRGTALAAGLLLATVLVVAPPGRPPDAEAAPASASFSAVSPCRIADTRLAGGPLTGAPRNFTVTGSSLGAQGGAAGGCSIPSGATAAVLTFSAVVPTSVGYLRVWPADQDPPTATVLNFTARQNVTNTAETPLSNSGQIAVRAFDATTHLVIDVTGYFLNAAPTVRFVPVAPCRIADTRLAGGPLTDTPRTISVTGSSLGSQGGATGGCSVPPSAIAAVLTLSAVSPSGTGYLRAWPADVGEPTATMLNARAGQNITNSTTLQMSASGQVSVRAYGAGTHLVVDITGYYASGTFAKYVPTRPCRIADTRPAGGALGSSPRTFSVTGTTPAAQGGSSSGCGVPFGASSAVLSLSAVNPAATGYLRAWPAGSAPPNATVLNAVAGGSITNTVTLPLSPAGELEARYVGGVTHLVVDVLGYFVDPPTSQRVSVRTGGSQAAGFSSHPSVSADGRFIAFTSWASDLVSGDTNGYADVFVHDRATATTTRVSVSSSGAQGNEASHRASISADGRYVAFESDATNLVPGDTNGRTDVFVHDRDTGQTSRVSVTGTGAQGNDLSSNPSISADGRTVAFHSYASNLVSGDTNGAPDVFVRNLTTNTTTRVSVGAGEVQGNDSSTGASISGDGTKVAFASYASNLVAGDTNGALDVFVRNLSTNTTVRASISSAGAQGNSSSFSASLDHTGSRVAFMSYAHTLVGGDTNGHADVFVRDLSTNITSRVSVSTGGVEGNSFSEHPALSADGRSVAFISLANNLVTGDTNASQDVFVRDLATNTTTRVSVGPSNVQANNSSDDPAISSTGHWVMFSSTATNLLSGSDTNGARDVFARGLL